MLSAYFNITSQLPYQKKCSKLLSCLLFCCCDKTQTQASLGVEGSTRFTGYSPLRREAKARTQGWSHEEVPPTSLFPDSGSTTLLIQLKPIPQGWNHPPWDGPSYIY